MNQKLIKKIQDFGIENGYVIEKRKRENQIILSFYDTDKEVVVFDILICEGESICNFPCPHCELDNFEESIMLDLVGMEV